MDCSSLLALDDATIGDLDELARRYQAARAYCAALADIADGIEIELAARMETDEVTIPGIGVLVRKAEKRSAWRDEYASRDFRSAVAKAVVNKVALDIATGELDPVKRNISQVTVDTLYDVIPAFSTIKSPGRRLGIHPEEFRTQSTVYRVAVDDGGEPR